MFKNTLIVLLLWPTIAFAGDNALFDSRVKQRMDEYPSISTEVARKWTQANIECSGVMEHLLEKKKPKIELTLNSVSLFLGLVVVPTGTAYSCLNDSKVCRRNVGIGLAAISGLTALSSQLSRSASSDNATYSERMQHIQLSENILSGQITKLGEIVPKSEQERTALELITNYRQQCIQSDLFTSMGN